MARSEPILLVRKAATDGAEISLDQWLSYVASSSIVTAQPRTERKGINPFTKQPTVYRCAPGGAFFDGPQGRCEIQYHARGLVDQGAIGAAVGIAAQIAEALGAEVQKVGSVEKS